MKEKIQIIKIERTDSEIDNSKYEFKIPYEHQDDYGNKGIFYRKEERLCNEYDAEIVSKKTQFMKELEEITKTEIELEKVKEEVISKEIELKNIK